MLWVDLNREEAFSHNDVKWEIACALHRLARDDRGHFLADGMHFSHPGANFSTMPDGMFVTFDALQAGRVQEMPDAQGRGVVELVGAPDMVLEVVSDGSVEKDTVTMPGLYQAAGIPEFWRVDARAGLHFAILRLTPAGYAGAPLAEGWWHSDVFGHDFRPGQRADRLGRPEFILEVR